MQDVRRGYRPCEATKYAISNNALTNGNGYCWWWLRSPGDVEADAAYVTTVGLVDDIGISVSYDNRAVRPALWITLKP